MGSALGAGAGADMLRQVLQQKFEQIFAQQKLNEDMRQADMQNQVQRSGLDLGNRRLGEETRQFDAQEPLRGAQVSHLGAETADLQGRPQMAAAAQSAAAANAEAQRTFTGGQNEANRTNAVKIANINGARTIEAAKIRAANGGQAQTAQQQNEVADSIALIDQIANDPALATAVGPIDQYVGKARDLSGVNRFQALNDQLVGKLSLAQAGKLKGQGQISDKERALLASAATALRRGLSEQDYKNELGKIRSQFERMQAGGPIAPAAGKGGFTVVEIK